MQEEKKKPSTKWCAERTGYLSLTWTFVISFWHHIGASAAAAAAAAAVVTAPPGLCSAAALRAAPQSKNHPTGQRVSKSLPSSFDKRAPSTKRRAELLDLGPNVGGVHGRGWTLGLQQVALSDPWPLKAQSWGEESSRDQSHECGAVSARGCPVPRSAATWSADLPSAA